MAEKITKEFDTSKPHVNIGTLGHVDHGKTTLTAAILTVLAKQGKAKKKSYEEIDDAQGSKSAGSRGRTINSLHAEFESDKRHYSLIDCPGHEDYIKNMITGAAQMDGAILVVASDDGTNVQTRSHMLLAKQIGVDHMVVFINDKSDKGLTEDEKELAEMDIREQLEKHGYDKDSTPIIFASALRALKGEEEEEKEILKLIETVDSYIPDPVREIDKPFLMYIEGTFSIDNVGTVATGKIQRGKVKVGEEVEIVGLGQKKKGVVKGIQSFRKDIKGEALAGNDVGICLRGIKLEEIEKGQVLAQPGTATPHKKFIAYAQIFGKEEGGRHTPFEANYRPQFFFSTADVTGTITNLLEKKERGEEKFIEFSPEDKEVKPGSHVKFKVELIGDVHFENNSRFIMREGSYNVGKGVVTEIIE